MASVYRNLDHAPARRKLLGPEAVAISPDVRKVGLHFATLQDRRHLADYAPPSKEAMLNRRDVLVTVGEARAAIALLSSLAPRARQRLALLLLMSRRAS